MYHFHLFTSSARMSGFFWSLVLVGGFNPSQHGNLPQVGVKIKNIWNHHLVVTCHDTGEKASLYYPYCWGKKSCTTQHVGNPVNNEIFIISTGAGFLPSTVGSMKMVYLPSWTVDFYGRYLYTIHWSYGWTSQNAYTVVKVDGTTTKRRLSKGPW